MATTNYDDLITQVTGLPVVVWTETDKLVRVIRGEEKGIIHLHGCWNRPESVVLGTRSYDKC